MNKRSEYHTPQILDRLLEESVKYLYDTYSTIIRDRVSVLDIKSNTRRSEVVFVKAITAFYLYNIKNLTLVEIQELFNAKTHATVINLINYGKESRKASLMFRKYFKYITEDLIEEKVNITNKNKLLTLQVELNYHLEAARRIRQQMFDIKREIPKELWS